jgi:hypothetical protein
MPKAAVIFLTCSMQGSNSLLKPLVSRCQRTILLKMAVTVASANGWKCYKTFFIVLGQNKLECFSFATFKESLLIERKTVTYCTDTKGWLLAIIQIKQHEIDTNAEKLLF